MKHPGRHHHVPQIALAALLLFPIPLLAQGFSVAAGYGKVLGSVGDGQSDRGGLARIGVTLAARGALLWSVEGEVHRQNEHRIQATNDCLRPDASVGPCFFDSRWRDTGWSLGANLRIHGGAGGLRPYALVGLGVMSVRTRSTSVAVDELGNDLPNFSGTSRYNDDGLVVQLGGGVATHPAHSPLGFFVEARGSRFYHVYDGSPMGHWNPSLVVGVRTGGGR